MGVKFCRMQPWMRDLFALSRLLWLKTALDAEGWFGGLRARFPSACPLSSTMRSSRNLHLFLLPRCPRESRNPLVSWVNLIAPNVIVLIPPPPLPANQNVGLLSIDLIIFVSYSLFIRCWFLLFSFLSFILLISFLITFSNLIHYEILYSLFIVLLIWKSIISLKKRNSNDSIILSFSFQLPI